jgi:hypothetical protein
MEQQFGSAAGDYNVRANRDTALLTAPGYGRLLEDSRSDIRMLTVLGSIDLLTATMIAIVGMLSRDWAAHPLTESFSLSGFRSQG